MHTVAFRLLSVVFQTESSSQTTNRAASAWGIALTICHEIFPALNLALVLFRGDIDMPDQVAAVHALAADADYRPTMHKLFDLEGCHFPRQGFEEMRLVAYQSRRAQSDPVEGSRNAVYAPGDVAYGMVRMLHSLMEGDGRERSAFRTRDEAQQFLGLKPENPALAGFLARWNQLRAAMPCTPGPLPEVAARLGAAHP